MPTTILSGRNKWLRAVCWMCWGYWLRYSLFFSISAQTCIKREKSDGDVYDVRFGSKADIALPPIDVRFTPESGHWPTRFRMSASGQFRIRWSGPRQNRLSEICDALNA
jgi:hypothetical protein